MVKKTVKLPLLLKANGLQRHTCACIYWCKYIHTLTFTRILM